MRHPADGEVEWNEYRMARLRALHADDRLSFDVIAEELSVEFKAEVSKNACIGKARRMGLPQRRRNKSIPRETRKRALELRPPEAVPCVLPRWKVMEVPRPAPGTRITLFQLTDNKCRWPHGDRTPYLFCGAPTAGKTYCAYHTGISCGRMVRMARDRVNT